MEIRCCNFFPSARNIVPSEGNLRTKQLVFLVTFRIRVWSAYTNVLAPLYISKTSNTRSKKSDRISVITGQLPTIHFIGKNCVSKGVNDFHEWDERCVLMAGFVGI